MTHFIINTCPLGGFAVLRSTVLVANVLLHSYLSFTGYLAGDYCINGNKKFTSCVTIIYCVEGCHLLLSGCGCSRLHGGVALQVV